LQYKESFIQHTKKIYAKIDRDIRQKHQACQLAKCFHIRNDFERICWGY
jgi:hypothetical protein